LIVQFAVILTSCLSALAACAVPTDYVGISLVPGDADPEIQSLARSAQAGSKHAELELGIRYEEGDGLPVDLDRARALYKSAAPDTGGTIWVYSPPVGSSPGQVIPVDTGPKQLGLVEAKKRLEEIE